MLSRSYRRAWAVGAVALLATLVITGCARSGGASPGEDVAEPQFEMGIELPGDVQVSLPFTVSGWAIDRGAMTDTGIDVVQIVDDGCQGAVIGVAEYGLKRADIGSRYGQQFLNSGWEFEVTRLRAGDHTLAVRIGEGEVVSPGQCHAIQITVE